MKKRGLFTRWVLTKKEEVLVMHLLISLHLVLGKDVSGFRICLSPDGIALWHLSVLGDMLRGL